MVALPPWVDELDEAADAAWEILRGHAVLDRLFYTASTVGDFSVIWHGYNVVRLIVHPHQKDRFLRLAAGLAFESLVVNQVVKRAFRRGRPPDPEHRPHHLRQPSTSSFPSGHASAATFAAILLSERSRTGPLNALLAATVATSRVHVRIHHASDVVVGAAVGGVLALAWRRLWPLGGG